MWMGMHTPLKCLLRDTQGRNSVLSSELRRGAHLGEREFKEAEEITKGVVAMMYIGEGKKGTSIRAG